MRKNFTNESEENKNLLEEVEKELKKVVKINSEIEEKRLEQLKHFEKIEMGHRNTISMLENDSRNKLQKSQEELKNELERVFNIEREEKASSLSQLVSNHLMEIDRLQEKYEQDVRAALNTQDLRLTAKANGKIEKGREEKRRGEETREEKRRKERKREEERREEKGREEKRRGEETREGKRGKEKRRGDKRRE